MSVTLVDLGDKSHQLRGSFWLWRPTIEIIRKWELLDEETLDLMGYNSNVEVPSAAAHRIGERIVHDVLTGLTQAMRVRSDLSLTIEPDDYRLHREEPGDNYAATREWLERFANFCLQSSGFAVC